MTKSIGACLEDACLNLRAADRIIPVQYTNSDKRLIANLKNLVLKLEVKANGTYLKSMWKAK